MQLENRRSILWLFLVVSLFILGDDWQHHQGHKSILFGPGTEVVQQPVPLSSNASVPAGEVPSASPSPTAVPAASASGSAAIPAAVPQAPGQQIAITTDEYSLDVDTRGAGIDRLELLNYRAAINWKQNLGIINDVYGRIFDVRGGVAPVDPKSNLVFFEKSPQHIFVAETGLTGGDQLPNHLSSFHLVPGPTTMQSGQDTLAVSFEAQGGGVRLLKTYTFKRGSYEIAVTHQVTNVGDKPIDPALYLELVRDASKPEGSMPMYSPYYGPAVYRDADKYQVVPFDDIEKAKEKASPREATDGWVAILQHYFVAAWIPATGIARTYHTERVQAGSLDFRAMARVPLGTIAPGASVTNESKLFVGPQIQSLLEQVAPGLDLTRNYGWTKLLATPVFWLLSHLHALLGNWGWAIVALTIMIKAVFFPLSAASYRSMARMKSVAPRLKVLQERHKDDRAKLNQAMMELYRTEKINPMGGCLPILIQIPVFIALYSVISSSAELRGAPWILWIHDLAAPDYFSILPAIMMASMFVTYKLNPAPPDPVQARMMLIMPLVFGITFFVFPAGLVLYWVVNSLLSIGQQWFITRRMNPDKTPPK